MFQIFQRVDVLRGDPPEFLGHGSGHAQSMDPAFHRRERQLLIALARQRHQILGIEFRGRGAKLADVKALGDLIQRHPQFHRLARPQPRHQAQQGLGRDPAGAQIAQRQRAQTFRQLLAPRPGQQAVVGKARRRAAHGFHDLDLRRGIGHVVGAAHDMGHAHIHIIHRRGEGIKHLPIGPDQHRVRHRARINRDVAQNAIGPFDAGLVQLEPPIAIAALGAHFGALLFAQMQARAVIDRRLAHVQLLLAFEVELGRRFKAFIEPARCFQHFCLFGIALQPQRLPLDLVPGQAQPFQILHQRIDIFLLGALTVGVVQTQDELAAGFAGDQIVEQRGAQVAHMDVTGGRRGETGDGGHRGSPVAFALSQGGAFVHIWGRRRAMQ